MTCSLVQGQEVECRDNLGGVQEIYIANFENIQAITESSGVITDITMVGSSKFYTFQLRQEDAEYTNPSTSSRETGSTFYDSTVVFSMKKMSASQKNSISNIVKARLMVIVKDNNGTFFVVGETRGADALETTNSSGKAFGDLNGAIITISGKEPDFDKTFTGSIAEITD